MVRDVTEGKLNAELLSSWLTHLKIYLEIVKRSQDYKINLPTLILEDDVVLESYLK